MYDLIILGGGPAGVAASVYAARKNLKSAIITDDFGGQSIVSEKIYNWIGIPEISGTDLGLSLKKHVLAYKGDFLDIIDGEYVNKIIKDENFIIVTKNNKEFKTRAIIIATGSGRKKLTALNSDKFEHKGITYCASCDGPMFKDQDILVIGGGNAGFETAIQLLSYCKTVTLIHRSNTFKADETTIKKILENPKFKIIKNVEIIRVDGSQFVESLTYKNKENSEETTIKTTGIFVEIGQTPNTDFALGLVGIDEIGKIIVDPKTQMTNIEGIWAAGDCSNGKYHQNSIALGDGVKALEDAYIWIQKNK